MTVEAVNNGSGAVVDQWAGDTGLEDIEASDITLPRISIDHKTAEFKENLTGWRTDVLRVILLGLVKQRIFWHDDVEDGDKPLCKSPDFGHGFPFTSEDVPRAKRFPWDQSNFSPSDAVPVTLAPMQDKSHPAGWDSNGFPCLPCSACKFKDWSKDATGKSIPPPCSEQHTFPVMYETADGGWARALLTLQRTGLKPSKTYISAFAGAGQPMFTAITEIRLTPTHRGTVDYAVPRLVRVGATEREKWGEYATAYRQMRDYIRSAPRIYGDDDDVTPTVSDNTNTAPEATVQTTTAPEASTPPTTPSPSPAPTPTPPPTPSPGPTPSAAADDSDLPF